MVDQSQTAGLAGVGMAMHLHSHRMPAPVNTTQLAGMQHVCNQRDNVECSSHPSISSWAQPSHCTLAYCFPIQPQHLMRRVLRLSGLISCSARPCWRVAPGAASTPVQQAAICQTCHQLRSSVGSVCRRLVGGCRILVDTSKARRGPKGRCMSPTPLAVASSMLHDAA